MLEECDEFFSGDLDVMFDYFGEESAVDVFTCVMWNDGCSTVRMFKKHVASFLSFELETEFAQNFCHFLGVEKRDFAHALSSIC